MDISRRPIESETLSGLGSAARRPAPARSKSTGAPSGIGCTYCHLPMPHAIQVSAEQTAYCCYGCRLAAQITGSSGAAGHARWMLTRLGIAVVLSMAVMVFSLPLYGESVYAAPGAAAIPSVFARELTGLLRYSSLLLAIGVFLLLATPILVSAMEQLRRGVATTDALVVAGVAATLVYSATATVRERGPTYFETACMVLVLVTLGRYLEATGKIKASAAIRSLESLLPDTVDVVRDGRRTTVSLDQVGVGEAVLVAAGRCIPVDGTVIDGRAGVNEAIVSGESEPVVKQMGDTVRAGTMNLDGALTVRVTATGAESTVGRLTSAMDDARRSKGRFERLADRLTTVFLPFVIVLAGFGAWMGYQRSGADEAIMTGLSVLLISCPCALGIATPLAVWIAYDAAAQRGVLFRNGEAVEALADVRGLAMDKTGTLTDGDPTVTDVVFHEVGDGARDDLIALAAGLGATSTHPLARSLRRYAEARDVEPRFVGTSQTVAGRGVIAEVDGATVRLGSLAMMKDADVEFEEAIAPDSAQPDRGGAVYLARNDRPLATFVFSESLRPTARRAVQGLQRLGCTVRMLTGDRADRGAALAGELDVAALTEQSPQDKLAALRAFRGAVGPVAMVGDGINDAPSLAAADVGIAMACGADVSREAADVCLIGDDLRALPRAIHLARRTVRTIRMNLLWAFAYNAIGLPLAMTGKLNPVFAAVAMVASSLAVVANSARLRRIGLMEEP